MQSPYSPGNHPLSTPLPTPKPHVPYISGTEHNSVSDNAHRWQQDEDPPDPAIDRRSWPSATCR